MSFAGTTKGQGSAQIWAPFLIAARAAQVMPFLNALCHREERSGDPGGKFASRHPQFFRCAGQILEEQASSTVNCVSILPGDVAGELTRESPQPSKM